MGDASHTLNPRIYVACLAAYNNGHLHGQWIDAAQAEEDIFADINAMLATSPIADAEDFGGARIEEYSGIAQVSALAAFIREHGALGAELLSHFSGDLDEAARTLEDRYLGVFGTLAEYVQSTCEETAIIPESLRPYIDWDSMAFDAELNGDLFTLEAGAWEVHVFAGH